MKSQFSNFIKGEVFESLGILIYEEHLDPGRKKLVEFSGLNRLVIEEYRVLNLETLESLKLILIGCGVFSFLPNLDVGKFLAFLFFSLNSLQCHMFQLQHFGALTIENTILANFLVLELELLLEMMVRSLMNQLKSRELLAAAFRAHDSFIAVVS